jgi:NAD(P)-dependent dehydrogenase (short-subunit alcohol dehydrogenase family)
MRLQGKVALVAGSGRGLGRAYALRLASLGADVVINDIDLDAAREFSEELTAPTVMDEVRAHGGRSLGIQAGVTRKDQAVVPHMKARKSGVPGNRPLRLRHGAGDQRLRQHSPVAVVRSAGVVWLRGKKVHRSARPANRTHRIGGTLL